MGDAAKLLLPSVMPGQAAVLVEAKWMRQVRRILRELYLGQGSATGYREEMDPDGIGILIGSRLWRSVYFF